jgi:periplasmic divalent cation tolerance protein
MQKKFTVVLVTVPSKEIGERIAKALLERELIACANLLESIQSFYTWQGEMHIDNELLMVLKTRADLFQEKLVPAIQSLHPYDVPEIIAIPIEMGAQSYLNWMEEVTSGE